MKCPSCKITGGNMRRCKKCNKVYCRDCAVKGKGDYPKVSAANKCPYCKKLDCSETAR